ncbi:Uncharacterized protein OBRU01_21359 [Operophtera brumata]|uniref:C2H2-type domain-containing protein n=1 Tax=Operophtera brumata TaxID=104452 RepID=A0A0L7KSS4_OPEBR|nr:Uncharacterized protein OBRU01_21359 [Operophtera brumata]
MNAMPDSFVVNSCQYTPVYLIQDPGVSQGQSYFITQSNLEDSKPVSDNLKAFYESSGNIEGFVSVNSSPKPRILKKQDSGAVGNNLKLASFLQPKNEGLKHQYLMNGAIVKPNVTLNSSNGITSSTTYTTGNNTILNLNSKIVKLKDVALKTSVNQLSDEQMKMVAQAMKLFTNPEKIAPESTSDPVTKTNFIYNVNQLSDEQMKMVAQAMKLFTNPEKIAPESTSDPVTKTNFIYKKVKLPKPILPENTPHKPKKKTTLISCFQCSSEFNSLYRLQKHYESHPTHIPSKIHSNLFHCLLAIVLSGAEGDRTNIFLQQLQQLVVKLRSLLPCLLSSEGGAQAATVSEDVGRNTEGYCRHNPPPLPPKVEPETTANQAWATINEDLATTNTSEIETDDCARINSVEKWPTVSKRVWKQKQRKSALENAKRMRLASENNDTLIELGIDDFVGLSNTSCTEKCSAIIGPKGADNKADSHLVKDACNNFEDSMKLAQEPESSLPQEPEPNDYLNPNPTSSLPDTANSEQIVTTIADVEEQTKQNNHLQFHSAHFDIRSSPIKPTSTVFRKFQINPELLAKYETPIIQSIENVDKEHETAIENIETDNQPEHFKEVPSVHSNSTSTTPNKEDSSEDTDHLVGDDTLGEIFRDEELSAVKESFILDRELKDWILNRSNDKSEDGFGKSNTLIEPSLIHVKDHEIKSLSDDIEQKTGLQPSDTHDESSVLNFLDTFGNDSLSFPGTEIRTNGDFQLDLFSFHSS